MLLEIRGGGDDGTTGVPPDQLAELKTTTNESN